MSADRNGHRTGSVRIALFAAAAALVAGGVSYASHGGIHCSGGYCPGTQNSDSIIGSGVHDEISAMNGNDYIEGREGGDEVLAGANADLMFAQGGNDDPVRGGDNGDDYPCTVGGTVYLHCLGVNGDGGDDRILGDDGPDVGQAGFGDDRVEGNVGNDTLYAIEDDNRSDVIYGGGGVDECLIGEPGLDAVFNCE